MKNRDKLIFALALALCSSLTAMPPALAAGMDMPGMDMNHSQQAGNAKQKTETDAVGVVNEIDAAKGIVSISHEPIKSLDWPAMTMDFVVKDKKMLAKLRKGKKIHFSFVEQHGDYVVTKVK